MKYVFLWIGSLLKLTEIRCEMWKRVTQCTFHSEMWVSHCLLMCTLRATNPPSLDIQSNPILMREWIPSKGVGRTVQGINFMYQYALVCTNMHTNFMYQYAFSLSMTQSLWMSSEVMVTPKIRGIVFIHTVDTKLDGNGCHNYIGKIYIHVCGN